MSYRSKSFTASWQSQSWSLRVTRLFLGITWIYAGWDKASDPGFLTKGADSYIGTELTAYAQNSPIAFLLDRLLEHAQIVGIFVMLTEFAIGIAILLWIAPTLAAFGGFTMALGLWLASSWNVKPYFLASDSAYTFLWLGLFLTLYSQRGRFDVNLERRSVMRVGTVAVLAVAGGFLGKVFPASAKAATTTSNAAGAPKKIVKLASLKVGANHKFQTSRGIPAFLFRTSNGVFAYSAICTHEGCTVAYSSGAKQLQCGCHGAKFDPFNGAKAVGGPTNTPLAKVKVAVSGAWVVEV
jgi:Rieske Fe-S protein/uncharacterized membrane protein YphA (DoxX/SURF4 family)